MQARVVKKLMVIMWVALFVLGTLSGCGSKSDGKSEDGTIKVKFGIHVADPEKQETATYNIVQAFNEQNKGKYEIEFVASDTESHSKNMKLASTDGSLPDLFWVDASEAPEYSNAGVLLELSEFLDMNADIKKALNGMEEAFVYEDGQFGLPYQCNMQGIFYNKELFDNAGVDYPTDETTYEDLIEMIKKLKESGVTPLAIGSKNSSFAMWEFNETLARYGWEENIDDILSGKEKFNNEDLQLAFEKLKGIAEAGAFPENMATIEYFDAKQLFNEKKAAMFGTGQWDCAEFDENIGDKIGFWWGPRFTDSNYNQEIVMKVPSAPIVVNAEIAEDEEKEKAVFEFLKFYYGEEAAEISYKESIFPATNYSNINAEDTQYSINEMLNALSNGWLSPKAAPDLTLSSGVQAELYNSMFGVMQDTYSPTEALDKIDAALVNDN
jgi:raffinose/stachyose/melibiose transport system substrate-binding protein